MDEKSMARALGLLPRAQPIELVKGLVVTMSVREGTGLVRRYVYQSQTIFRDLAIIEAYKAVRLEGLTPWALLDVEQG